MKSDPAIRLKSDDIILTKKKLNLALNILISLLGISSLFIKFFLIDGVLAFRAFTVDGNLFTTVVSVIVVVVNIRELCAKQEQASRWLFFLQLASAVTEAVIFIIVMMGYLPIFPDEPKITPYHMFCLHVAIPVLAVLRFIFFEKPQGILKPIKLLIGSIPIGVYGIGVITAIKLGILPTSLVPYSFLDFESNFLWYFFFAMIVIPSFGYLWSWLFYRLNIRASVLWYSADDMAKLNKARIKQLSSFDVVNSTILIVYCAMAIFVLMFSLMATSNTATKVQQEMMTYINFYMSDDFDYMLGSSSWYMEDGILYKGDLPIGDGTEENSNQDILDDESVNCETSIFVQAKDLSPEIADNYDPSDYVSVKHSAGKTAPVTACGETLDKALVEAILASDSYSYYEEITIAKENYYHYCQAFDQTEYDTGMVILSMYFPTATLIAQVKDAEYNNDIMIIAVIVATFAVLFAVSTMWIRTLEKTVNYLKAIASGRIPDEPITLGKTLRLSGLERDLNVLWEINKD